MTKDEALELLELMEDNGVRPSPELMSLAGLREKSGLRGNATPSRERDGFAANDNRKQSGSEQTVDDDFEMGCELNF